MQASRRRSGGFWVTGSVGLAALAACSGTTDDVAEPDTEPGAFLLAWDDFLADEPAVADGWYDYDSSSHAVTPKAEVYVARETTDDGDRYGALRLVSYYDPETSDSGRFTVITATWNGASWAATPERILEGNVKEAAVCLDLFAGSAGEVACTNDDGWQIQLRADQVLVPGASLVVNNPGLFFRSAAGIDERVRGAVVDGATAVDEVTDPATLPELTDGPASSWDELTWDRGQLAPDLPERGMLLGPRAFGEGMTATGDVVFLVNASFRLLRIAVTPVAEGDIEAGVALTYAVSMLDREALEATGFSAPFTDDVRSPTEGQRRYLALGDDGLIEVLGGSLFLPPASNTWDLALDRASGRLRLLLSPSAVAVNGTALGGLSAESFEDALPPGATELTP